jgi:DNA-binding response OmpR family regulator
VGESASPLIAVVDDEPDIRELLRLTLSRAGFRVEGFPDAGSFWRFLEKETPALVLLDLMLPDADGLEVCRALRRRERGAAVPVIMLTAKGAETDKVLGLELGADDYVTKPFSIKELTARVHAVLRRPARDEETKRIEVGPLVIDLEKHEVQADGRLIELTATEFRILQLLATRRGRVLTRNQILDVLWGHEKIVVDRTIDVHIRNLREKLGPAAALLKNVRGVGYKVEE